MEMRQSGAERRKSGAERKISGAERRKCTLGPPYISVLPRRWELWHHTLTAQHVYWPPWVTSDKMADTGPAQGCIF